MENVSPTELLIMRHAEAGSPPAGGSDADRPLTSQGRRDAALQGAWLHHHGLHPDAILASTARRAAETAEIVLSTLAEAGKPAAAITWKQALYLAPLPRLERSLAQLPERPQRLLLVGHNPGLHVLVEHLSGAPLAMGAWGRAFPPASVAHVLLPRGLGALERGCGELAHLQPAQMDDEN
ncbi:MAG: phosphohistidine phosphatase [Pseudohongiellaceae bacterium]|jgi:phosphohistidine phosphatase